MNDFGEILIAMTAVVLGCTIVLIPVAGLTLRFAVKPLIEAWKQTKEVTVNSNQMAMLERRIQVLEKQVETLDRDNTRLLEEVGFRERLSRPA